MTSVIFVTSDCSCKKCKYHVPGEDECLAGHISILSMPNEEENSEENEYILECEDYMEVE